MSLLAAIEAETSLVCLPGKDLPALSLRFLSDPEQPSAAGASYASGGARLAEHGPVRVVGLSTTTGPSHLTEVINKPAKAHQSSSVQALHAFLTQDGLFLLAEVGSGPLRITSVINLRKSVLVIHPVEHPSWIDWQFEIVHAGGSITLASASDISKSLSWLRCLRRVVLRCANALGPPSVPYSEQTELLPLQHRLIRGTLHWAAATGNAGVLRSLLRMVDSMDEALGFKVTSQDDTGRTPLHFAALSGNVRGATL
jgi:hypothetical protein